MLCRLCQYAISTIWNKIECFICLQIPQNREKIPFLALLVIFRAQFCEYSMDSFRIVLYDSSIAHEYTDTSYERFQAIAMKPEGQTWLWNTFFSKFLFFNQPPILWQLVKSAHILIRISLFDVISENHILETIAQKNVFRYPRNRK